jgi:hypothetical protein
MPPLGTNIGKARAGKKETVSFSTSLAEDDEALRAPCEPHRSRVSIVIVYDDLIVFMKDLSNTAAVLFVSIPPAAGT